MSGLAYALMCGRGGVDTGKDADIGKVLDNSREGTTARIRAKLIEERWLSIDGYGERELTLKVMRGDVEIGTALCRKVVVSAAGT